MCNKQKNSMCPGISKRVILAIGSGMHCLTLLIFQLKTIGVCEKGSKTIFSDSTLSAVCLPTLLGHFPLLRFFSQRGWEGFRTCGFSPNCVGTIFRNSGFHANAVETFSAAADFMPTPLGCFPQKFYHLKS